MTLKALLKFNPNYRQIWLLIKMFIKREWDSLVYSMTTFVRRAIVFIGRGSAAETDVGRFAMVRHKQSQRQQRSAIRVQRKRIWRKWKRGPSKRFLAAQKAAEAAILQPSDFNSGGSNIVEKFGAESFIQFIIVNEYVQARVHNKR